MRIKKERKKIGAREIPISEEIHRHHGGRSSALRIDKGPKKHETDNTRKMCVSLTRFHCIREKVIRLKPAVPRSAPRQSSTFEFIGVIVGLGLCKGDPNGGQRDRIFRKNTQRQDPCCTIQPPTTGPSAVIMAAKPDHLRSCDRAQHRRS